MKTCPLRGYKCYTHNCEWYILHDGKYKCAITVIPTELFELRKWYSILIPNLFIADQ